MEVKKQTSGTTLTIYAAGRLDAATAIDFGNQISDALDEQECKELILNFADINYISSMGLRIVLELQKRMSDQGSMKIKNVTAPVMDVFEMTGFTNILTII